MLHISADPQGKFTVSAHGETWLKCPAMIAVDANGEKDSDERYLPMAHRAKLCKAAMEDVLIDTDAGGVGSRRDFQRWMKAQPELGIPDLYYLTAAGDVPFDEEDIALIRGVWNDYEIQRKKELN